MPKFPSAIIRYADEKAGENPSVLDWIPQALHTAIYSKTSTTNVRAYIQTAIDEVTAAGGGSLEFPQGKYKVDSGITVDLSYVSLRGNGVDLDFSGMAFGVALTVTGSVYSGDDHHEQSRFAFDGLLLRGPGKTATGVTGIKFDYPIGVNQPGPAFFYLAHSCIRDFATALECGDNAYLMEFVHTTFTRIGKCFYIPSTVTNSGERISFQFCTFNNCDAAVYCRHQWSDIYFDKCSFDFNTGRLVHNEDGGWMYFDSCHFENNEVLDDNWFYVSGTDSHLAFKHCTFVNGSATALPHYLFNSATANSHGGIHLDTCYMEMYSAGGYPQKHYCEGAGPIYAHDVIQWGATQPTIAENLNILVNGDFEDATAGLREFRLYGDALPTITAAQYHSGSKSLALVTPATTNAYSHARVEVAIGPGEKAYCSFWAKASGLVAATKYFRVDQYFHDRNGTLLRMNRQEWDGTTGEALTDWTLLKTYNEPAPMGTCQMHFDVYAFGSSVSAFVDELTINVCGRNNVERDLKNVTYDPTNKRMSLVDRNLRLSLVDGSGNPSAFNVLGGILDTTNYIVPHGYNIEFDGTNWVSGTDGVHNGWSIVACNWGTGDLRIYVGPDTGATAQTITPANLASYLVFSAKGTEVLVNRLGFRYGTELKIGNADGTHRVRLSHEGTNENQFNVQRSQDSGSTWAKLINCLLNVDIVQFLGALRLANGSLDVAYGSGTPERNISASPGSIYLDTGGALWYKKTGTGNTGWKSAGGGALEGISLTLQDDGAFFQIKTVTGNLLKFAIDSGGNITNCVNITASGDITFSSGSLTATRPMKLNGSKKVISGKIDFNEPNDIAFTGAPDGSLIVWSATAGYCIYTAMPAGGIAEKGGMLSGGSFLTGDTHPKTVNYNASGCITSVV